MTDFKRKKERQINNNEFDTYIEPIQQEIDDLNDDYTPALFEDVKINDGVTDATDDNFINSKQGMYGMTKNNKLYGYVEELKEFFLTTTEKHKGLQKTQPQEIGSINLTMKFILFILTMNLDRVIPYNESSIVLKNKKECGIDIDHYTFFCNNIWQGPVSGVRNMYIFVLLNQGFKTEETDKSLLASAITGIVCTTCPHTYITKKNIIQNFVGCQCGRFKKVLNFMTKYELPRKAYAYFNHTWSINTIPLFADNCVELIEESRKIPNKPEKRDLVYKIPMYIYILLKECVHYSINGYYNESIVMSVPDIDVSKNSLLKHTNYIGKRYALYLSDIDYKYNGPTYHSNTDKTQKANEGSKNISDDHEGEKVVQLKGGYTKKEIKSDESDDEDSDEDEDTYDIIDDNYTADILRFFTLFFSAFDDYANKMADMTSFDNIHAHHPFYWLYILSFYDTQITTSHYVSMFCFRKGYSILFKNYIEDYRTWMDLEYKKNNLKVSNYDLCFPLPKDSASRLQKKQNTKISISEFIKQSPQLESNIIFILLRSDTIYFLNHFRDIKTKCIYTHTKQCILEDNLLNNENVKKQSSFFNVLNFKKSFYKEYLKFIEDNISMYELTSNIELLPCKESINIDNNSTMNNYNTSKNKKTKIRQTTPSKTHTFASCLEPNDTSPHVASNHHTAIFDLEKKDDSLSGVTDTVVVENQLDSEKTNNLCVPLNNSGCFKCTKKRWDRRFKVEKFFSNYKCSSPLSIGKGCLRKPCKYALNIGKCLKIHREQDIDYYHFFYTVQVQNFERQSNGSYLLNNINDSEVINIGPTENVKKIFKNIVLDNHDIANVDNFEELLKKLFTFCGTRWINVFDFFSDDKLMSYLITKGEVVNPTPTVSPVNITSDDEINNIQKTINNEKYYINTPAKTQHKKRARLDIDSDDNHIDAVISHEVASIAEPASKKFKKYNFYSCTYNTVINTSILKNSFGHLVTDSVFKQHL
ncbi:hypothetical protein EON71_00560 [bacterium]|nr:MAG: hypothetical protein EON71_00560 [bacterium]